MLKHPYPKVVEEPDNYENIVLQSTVRSGATERDLQSQTHANSVSRTIEIGTLQKYVLIQCLYYLTILTRGPQTAAHSAILCSPYAATQNQPILSGSIIMKEFRNFYNNFVTNLLVICLLCHNSARCTTRFDCKETTVLVSFYSTP